MPAEEEHECLTSYAGFIAHYAWQPAGLNQMDPVRRLGPIDQGAVVDMLLAEYGTTALRFEDVVQFLDELKLHAALLDGIAPLVARAARRLHQKGLIESRDGRTLTLSQKNGKAAKTKRQLAAEQGKRLSQTVGATLAQALPARRIGQSLVGAREAFTTERHSENYGLMALTQVITLAGAASLDADCRSVGTALGIVPQTWHSLHMDSAVLKQKLSSIDKCKLDVVITFSMIEDCVRCLLQGRRPSPAALVSWPSFWAAVMNWDDAASQVLKAVRTLGQTMAAANDPDHPNGHWQLRQIAKRALAEKFQMSAGMFRDGLLWPHTVGAACVRTADFHLAPFVAPFGIANGSLEITQGAKEMDVAQRTRALFKWRIQQLVKGQMATAGDSVLDMIRHTLVAYCERKKNIADWEVLFGATRVLSGQGRVCGSALTLLMLLGLKAGPYGPAIVAVSGLALAMALRERQGRRAKELRHLKRQDQDLQKLRALFGEAVRLQKFMEGFDIKGGAGDFNGDSGFLGEYVKAYGPGGNEALALEVLAARILDYLLEDPWGGDGPGLQMVCDLGLDATSKLLLRTQVEDLCYAGRRAAAVEAICGVIRLLLEAPTSRSAEAVNPSVFEEDFRVALDKVKNEAADPSTGDADDEDRRLEEVFFQSSDDGSVVSREAFEKSMDALDRTWAEHYKNVERTGIYERMLAFHRRVKQRKQAPPPMQVHLERWIGLQDHLRVTGRTVEAQARVERWLRMVAQSKGANWTEQLKVALQDTADRSGVSPMDVCRELMDELQQFDEPGIELPRFVVRFRTELLQALRQFAADVGRRFDPQTFDPTHWEKLWAPLRMPSEGTDEKLARVQRLVGQLMDGLMGEARGSLDERLPNALHHLARGRSDSTLDAALLKGMKRLAKQPQRLSWQQWEILACLIDAMTRRGSPSVQRPQPDSSPMTVQRDAWDRVPAYLLIDGRLEGAHADVARMLEAAQAFPGETWQDQLRNCILGSSGVPLASCKALLDSLQLLGKGDALKLPAVASAAEALDRALHEIAADLGRLDTSAFQGQHWSTLWQEMAPRTGKAGKAYAQAQSFVMSLLRRLADDGSDGALDERLPVVLKVWARGEPARRWLLPHLNEALDKLADLPGGLPWRQGQMVRLLASALHRLPKQ